MLQARLAEVGGGVAEGAEGVQLGGPREVDRELAAHLPLK